MKQNNQSNTSYGSEQLDNNFWRPTNPHDRFCRATIFTPMYASDFLKCYGDAILAKYIDLDNLQEVKTSYLSTELKEVIADASLATRLQDALGKTDVLLHMEHKSSEMKFVLIQMLTSVVLALHYRLFMATKKGELADFKLPIQLMVVVYNGDEDWDLDVWFQDFYENVPEELRPYLLQFKIIFINLRKFGYDEMPGKLSTQAIVQSMKRTTDGTFGDHLTEIFQLVCDSELEERQRLELTQNIVSYGTMSTDVPAKQFRNAITKVFQGAEQMTMLKNVDNEWIQIGWNGGKIEGKIEDVLAVLKRRFGEIPQRIVDNLGQRKDVTAMESLVVEAAMANSIDDFEALL
jgi:hypothetical protein